MWEYPKTDIEPVEDTIHGLKVTDKYRWLEDNENKKVLAWVEQQNAFTDKILNQKANFKLFQDDLVEYFEVPMFSAPVPVNGRYFWDERQPGEDQWVTYVKDGLDGKPRRLIDPNGMKEGNTVTTDYWFESPSGKLLAYGLSEGGDEIATLRIMDVDTGKDLADTIPNTTYTSLRWLPDDSGFFYTRHPKTGTVPKGEERHWEKIYLHQLGDDPDKDELIFGEGRPKDDMLGITLSLDGRYLGIKASQNWNRNDLYLYDAKTKKLSELIVGLDAMFQLYSTKDKLLLRTNHNAEKYKILWASFDDIPKSIDGWKEFIPESENLLDWYSVTADKILVGYMVDACDEVKIFDYEGREQGKLPMPPLSSTAGLSARRVEKEFFYGVTNFLSPKIMYRYDPETGEYSEYRRNDEPLDPKDYQVKQEWLESKDGTKLPMFVIHHKDIELNGQNPTILYGYGCHGISQTPEFLRSYIPWFKRKGVFAIANIRGGGEYGEQWHRDGSLDKKQNTFDDFIASAEHLISQKYTSPDHLGIVGGSNGGLMVGAVLTQRPDLFKAVVCRVPVLDLYRFHKFLIADRWVHEFGNPDKPEEFKWLEEWSPYHHVKEGTEYPNVLFTAGLNDTRVHPLHAWKMTALMQATNKRNIILLNTEMEAGHGPGKPVKKMVESIAYALAFFAWELGLKL